MPILTIQLDDGREADIEVPDNATEADIDSFVRESFPEVYNTQSTQDAPQAPVQKSQGQYTNMPIDEYLQQAGGQVKQEEQQAYNEKLNKNISYVPIISDVASGLAQGAYGLAEKVGAGVSGVGSYFDNKSLQDRGQQFTQKAQRKAELEANRIEDLQNKSTISGDYGLPFGVGDIAENVVPSALVGGGVAKQAITGALMMPTGGTTGNAEDVAKSTAINAGVGLALGKAGDIVFNTTGKALSEETAKLAKEARKMNIPLGINQVKPTAFRQTLEKTNQQAPFNTSEKFIEKQMEAFHENLVDTLGVKGKNLSPATLIEAKKQNKSDYERALNPINIDFNSDDLTKIQDLLNKSKTDLGDGSDGQRVVKNYYDMFMNNFNKSKVRTVEIQTPNKKTGNDLINFGGTTTPEQTYDSFEMVTGAMSGKKINSIRSDFLEASVADTTESKAKPYIAQMVEVLDEIIARNADEKSLSLLKKASINYRNIKTVENMKINSDGFINPRELMTKIRANKYIKQNLKETGQDKLVDLGKIGENFLPKLSGSDTMQKTALKDSILKVLGMGAGGAAVADVVTGGTIAGGGVALSRLYGKYNQSQKLVDKAIDKAIEGIDLSKVDESMMPNLVQSIARNISNQYQNAGNQSEPYAPQQEIDVNSDIFKPYVPTYNQTDDTQPTNTQGQESDIFAPYKPTYKYEYTQPQSSMEWSPESILPAIRQTESGGNDNARNNKAGVTASGRYGFNNDTWRLAVNKWGKETGITLKDRNNPNAQEQMAWRLMMDNKRIVENKIGREVLPEEAHILHFFGAGDAPKLFKALEKNPQAPAVAVFGGVNNRIVSDNKEYFFDGKKPVTISQLYDKFISNMER